MKNPRQKFFEPQVTSVGGVTRLNTVTLQTFSKYSF